MYRVVYHVISYYRHTLDCCLPLNRKEVSHFQFHAVPIFTELVGVFCLLYPQTNMVNKPKLYFPVVCFFSVYILMLENEQSGMLCLVWHALQYQEPSSCEGTGSATCSIVNDSEYSYYTTLDAKCVEYRPVE